MWAGSALWLLLGTARAEPAVGAYGEVDLVGLAGGLRAEGLLGGGFSRLRGAVGLLPGTEYFYLPLSAGWRGRILPARRVHPLVGAGLELQTFWVSDHAPFARGALYLETGLQVDVAEQWSVGLQLSPEVAITGVPGPGISIRLGVERRLPR